jgi:hypothetical protein
VIVEEQRFGAAASLRHSSFLGRPG